MKRIWMLAALATTAALAQTVTPVTGPSIKLGWTAPKLDTTGKALAGTTTYNVYQGACNATATFAKVQSGITGTSAVVTAGVTRGVTYGFRITAVNAGLPVPESAQSVTLCAVVGQVTTPPPVVTPPSNVAPAVPTGFVVLPS